ncbi:ABC transporter substrate-binding protein [Prochlorococcus marinus]|uniref:ABC transporter substrate-binding protein n=1 Tax=Prochlorococcus marinus TaxID=1219 RepID=UPI0022B4DE55|nr:ABC transporter substrate-binding protein [Prochlorococcus marinus]
MTTLSRRDFIRLGVLAGTLSLYGCSFGDSRATIRLPKGIIPKEFLKTLPSNWRYQLLDITPGTDFFKARFQEDTDLIAIGDGWLRNCPYDDFQSIASDDFLARYNSQAKIFLNNFSSEIALRLLPVAVSPWVMIFRRGENWASEAKGSWDVLLDSDLKGHIVFPNSPRLIMSLADRMSPSDSLQRLRKQAAAFDDVNGMNWLLSGKAKVAILPLQVCLKILVRDSRLRIAFPIEGAPLNWTLLLKPRLSLKPTPLEWIKQSWTLPLLVQLLSNGWIPPLPYSELEQAIDLLPLKYQVIYKSRRSFENSWSFSPLTLMEENLLEERWFNSFP